MKLRILAAGQRLPDWIDNGYMDYARRLPRELGVVLKEIPVTARKHVPVDRARRQEGDRMLTEITARDWVVALAVTGRMLSTEALAERLQEWQMLGRDVVFLIGGPDGLDSQCLERADERLSLSALTFPHGIIRVMLIEQLYRAWTVSSGHPYHRG